jgi:hypothetical protein
VIAVNLVLLETQRVELPMTVDPVHAPQLMEDLRSVTSKMTERSRVVDVLRVTLVDSASHVHLDISSSRVVSASKVEEEHSTVILEVACLSHQIHTPDFANANNLQMVQRAADAVKIPSIQQTSIHTVAFHVSAWESLRRALVQLGTEPS